MKPRARKWLSRLFILGTIAIVCAIAFRGNELTNAWDTLFTLDAGWLLAAAACWFGCLFFESLSCHAYLRRQHCRVPFARALYVTVIGYYYSNITPGASGGQPMQVYYLSKSGVPVGVATSCVIIKMVFNQLTLIAVGTALWLLNLDYVNAQLAGVKWIIAIGWLMNFAVVPIVALATFNRPLVQRLARFLTRLGAKLRLVRDVEAADTRVGATLDSYNESILRLGRHPWHIVMQLLFSALCMASLLAVALCVYHAFGSVAPSGGETAAHIMTVAYLLFISTSYTPLPGASGAQEGGFMVFFRGIFPEGSLGLALLVWRFFSYYLFLLVGMVCVVWENLRSSRRAPAAQGAKEASE